MKYYMKSKFFKIKEDFWIKNQYLEDAFFVDKKFLSFGLQFDILKDRKIMYSVRERLMTFMANYEISENGKVIAEVSQKLTFFKDKLKVHSKYGDLTVQGDIFDFNYKIIQDGRVIATASKELFAFTDNYEIDVDFEDHAFILSLVVIIDNIIDKQRNNSR